MADRHDNYQRRPRGQGARIEYRPESHASTPRGSREASREIEGRGYSAHSATYTTRSRAAETHGGRQADQGRVYGTSRRGQPQASRQASASRPSQAPRRPSTPRYSDDEIRRNRIIALAVLIVAVILVAALLVNLVSCAAHALGGDSREPGAESADPAQVEANPGAGQPGGSNGSDGQSPQQATTALASGEGVEDPWVPGGRFTTGDAELDQMVKKICDDNSSAGASAADNAFKTYCAVVWGEFIENDENQHPKGTDWDIDYAKQILGRDGGNCYEFAAANEFVLKYFGYQDVYAEPCFVYRESGSYGDHGLVFATDFDGRKCMCDSSFGANGWMLDADSYTMQVVDVGQDPSEFEIADFEKVAKASWA